VALIGITLVSNYDLERDVRMTSGESIPLSGYQFKFNGVTSAQGPNYTTEIGTFDVFKNGDHAFTLNPEKRFYNVQRMSMTEAGIDSNPLRDVFIALGEPLDDGAWAVRVYVKPFVTWIWAGAAIMGLGGLCSISDRRYRLARRVEKTKSKQPLTKKTQVATT
jgi:cytochrome c-type biogenesis protein CcmF